MAKRVRRVARVKRKRTRAAKKTDAVQAGDAAGGAALTMDLDGAGDADGAAMQRLRKMRRGGAGAGGQIEGELQDSDAANETEAATADGIRRKGRGSMGGGDGFGGREQGREAYDQILQGNIAKDAKKFEDLRAQGQSDSFDPGLDPKEVEMLGNLKAANHMVRLYDHWMMGGVDRSLAIEKAVEWLSGFSKVTNIKKVLIEMESKPIRDIYPLEVLVNFLRTSPQKVPGFEEGNLLGKTSVLSEDKRVFAGHPCQIPVPANWRLKAFALLGGKRPGYEFFPSPKSDQYTLQVDTPGIWEFALLGVKTEKLGKMERELPGGMIDVFSVHVHEMGRKESN
jgi:hypothetical protein